MRTTYPVKMYNEALVKAILLFLAEGYEDVTFSRCAYKPMKNYFTKTGAFETVHFVSIINLMKKHGLIELPLTTKKVMYVELTPNGLYNALIRRG